MDKVNQKALVAILNEVKDQHKEIIRRLDSLQKSEDLIYNDRELIRDVYEAVGRLRDLIITEHDHQESVSKTVKEEIHEVKDKVEEKTEDLKDHLDNAKSDIVKGVGAAVTKSEGIVGKVLGKKS